LSAWGDTELLVELLDRQFSVLAEASGTQKLVRLRRVLGFIEGEPQLAAILLDMQRDAQALGTELNDADAAVRAALAELWQEHGAEIQQRLADVHNPALTAYGTLDGYEAAIAARRTVSVVQRDLNTEGETKNLVAAFGHWWKWITDMVSQAGEVLPEPLHVLSRKLQEITAAQQYADRGVDQARRSLPWSAYARLVARRDILNPKPPKDDDTLAWIRFQSATQFADVLGMADEVDVGPVNDAEVDVVYLELHEDAHLLYEELRFRIGQSRSRVSLVQRYAARCEAFDAQRLRDLCLGDPGNAERLLTLDMARYFFDAGIPPLIDATVGALRPDVLHIGSSALFYVEAKQYSDAHPSTQIKKAVAQVWGTWARLRRTYNSREAFLVIFRRAGAWVEIPSVVRHEGLHLFIVIADLSENAGSREKMHPIRFTEEELRPAPADAQVVT
jgi:hypothetical protein